MLLSSIFRTSFKNATEMVIDAGCRKPKWNEGFNHYHWTASGFLLAEGACVTLTSKNYLAPEVGRTKVSCIFENQKLRDIDSKKQTISFGVRLTMRWWDSRIKSSLFNQESKKDGIILRPASVKKIWTPDLIVQDQTSIKSRDKWISLVSAKVLPKTQFNEFQGQNSSEANIEATYLIKTTVFCDFDHSRYPLDRHECRVTFASSSSDAILIRSSSDGDYDKDMKYSTSTFEVEASFFDDGQHDSGRNTIGLHYVLTHSITPYIFKYYIPCVGIVTISMMGFTMPLTALPERVALLVTQFLTLTELFIHEMVCNVSETFY